MPVKRTALVPRQQTFQNETEFQLAAADFLRLAIGRDDGFFFHVPNQGKRSFMTGGLFKGMGMLPGMTDLVLVIRLKGGGPVTVNGWLELKHHATRKPFNAERAMSEPQVDFRDQCDRLGFPHFVAHDLGGVEHFTAKVMTLAGRSIRAKLS